MSPQSVQQSVIAVIRNLKGIKEEPIGEESRLLEDLQFESVQIMNLIVELEREFEMTFDDDDLDFENFETPASIARAVESVEARNSANAEPAGGAGTVQSESQQQTAQRYERSGFVIVDSLLDADLCHRLHTELQRVVDDRYREGGIDAANVSWYANPRNAFWIINTRFISEEIQKIATSEQILGTARLLLNCDSVIVLEDQFINLPPQGNGVAFHQDLAYFPLTRGSRVVSCWIALDDVGVQNGPLQLAAGTHHRGLGAQPTSLHKPGHNHDMCLIEELNSGEATTEIVEACVPRGGGVFFDGTLVHGSAANRSDRWRPAFSLHIASADSRFDASLLKQTPDPQLYDGLVDGGELNNRYFRAL